MKIQTRESSCRRTFSRYARYDETPVGSDDFRDCLYREEVNPGVTKRPMEHKKEDMSLKGYAAANKEKLLKIPRTENSIPDFSTNFSRIQKSSYLSHFSQV